MEYWKHSKQFVLDCSRLQPCLLRHVVVYTCAFAMAKEEVSDAEMKSAEDALVCEFQEDAQQMIAGNDDSGKDDPNYVALKDALNGRLYMRSALGQAFTKGA